MEIICMLINVLFSTGFCFHRIGIILQIYRALILFQITRPVSYQIFPIGITFFLEMKLGHTQIFVDIIFWNGCVI